MDLIHAYSVESLIVIFIIDRESVRWRTVVSNYTPPLSRDTYIAYGRSAGIARRAIYIFRRAFDR